MKFGSRTNIWAYFGHSVMAHNATPNSSVISPLFLVNCYLKMEFHKKFSLDPPNLLCTSLIPPPPLTLIEYVTWLCVITVCLWTKLDILKSYTRFFTIWKILMLCSTDNTTSVADKIVTQWLKNTWSLKVADETHNMCQNMCGGSPPRELLNTPVDYGKLYQFFDLTITRSKI